MPAVPEVEVVRRCIRVLPEMIDGRTVTTRVLLTPLTLAGDLLLSPFELLDWLRY